MSSVPTLHVSLLFGELAPISQSEQKPSQEKYIYVSIVHLLTYLQRTSSVLSSPALPPPAPPALLLWGVFPLSPLNLSTLLQLLSLFFSVSVIFFFTVLFLQSSVTFLTESPPQLHIPLPTSFGSLYHKPLGTASPCTLFPVLLSWSVSVRVCFYLSRKTALSRSPITCMLLNPAVSSRCSCPWACQQQPARRWFPFPGQTFFPGLPGHHRPVCLLPADAASLSFGRSFCQVDF